MIAPESVAVAHRPPGVITDKSVFWRNFKFITLLVFRENLIAYIRSCNKTRSVARCVIAYNILFYSNGVSMATPLLPDALWKLIEPLLPAPSSKPKGGRPRLSDRACLKGVLFVLQSGIPWRMLP